MANIEFYWTTKDQLQIYAKDWTIETPRAVVALVHGMGEHCNRYNHVARVLNENNYAVVGYDRRGHGQSEGKRGHAEKVDLLLDEIDDLLHACEQRYPNLPIVFYGHSMGGELVLQHCLQRESKVKSVFCSAPWIQLGKEPPKAVVAVAKLLKKVAPKLTLTNGLSINYLSRDPKEVKAYKDDPLVHSKISVSLAVGMMDATQFVHHYQGAFPKPLLIMHGADDQVTSPQASKAFYNRITGDKEYISLDEMYHEIHNEFGREQVFEKVLEWYDQKL